MPAKTPEASGARRRRWVLQGALVLLGAALGLGTLVRPGRAEPGAGAGAPPSADRVLEMLKAGNERFVKSRSAELHRSAAWRKHLTAGQHPVVTVIGCSDSRVPPELLFGEGFGDIFTIRVAGNVVDGDVAGSVEYGIDHLHTPVVLVLGHESCGAVTAAVHARAAAKEHAKEHGHGGAEPQEIRALLGRIAPALDGLDPSLEGPARIAAAVEANVRLTLRELQRVPDIANAVRAGRVRFVGAVYELATSRVRFLPEAR